MHLGLHSAWNKERIYKLLIAGNGLEQRTAAEDLVYYRAQKQLVRALKADAAATRELAINSLWQLWFHAAGERAFQLIEASQKSVENQDYMAALAVLDRVVKKYPRFAEGLNRRATLYWVLGQYDLAVADGERVLALNPDHFGAWQGMALCQFQLGDYVTARRFIRTALRIHPHDDTAQKFLKRCEEMLHKVPRSTSAPGEFA